MSFAPAIENLGLDRTVGMRMPGTATMPGVELRSTAMAFDGRPGRLAELAVPIVVSRVRRAHDGQARRICVPAQRIRAACAGQARRPCIGPANERRQAPCAYSSSDPAVGVDAPFATPRGSMHRLRLPNLVAGEDSTSVVAAMSRAFTSMSNPSSTFSIGCASAARQRSSRLSGFHAPLNFLPVRASISGLIAKRCGASLAWNIEADATMGMIHLAAGR